MLSIPSINSNLSATQQEGSDFLTARSAALLFWGVGRGKTLAALDAIDRINAERVLIVGTRHIVENTWPAEMAKWGFDADYGICTRNLKRRQQAVNHPVVLVNYENLKWFLEYNPEAFDLVIFDEISKMHAAGTGRFRAFQKHRKRFDRVWGLTASPTANHLLNIWGQVRTVTPEPLLEPTYTAFERFHFYPVDKDRHIMKPLPATEGWVTEQLDGLVHRAAAINENELIINDIDTPYDRVVCDTLIEDRVWGEVIVSNAAVLGNKLIQVAGGAVYDDDKEVVHLNSHKIERVVEIVDELQGEPLVVFYNYRHELARLREALPHAMELDVDAWNAGEIEVMLLHPASAGHGLNLQQGGHNILFFSLPWSLELYEQAIGRIHRQGQTHGVTVHRLLAGFDYEVARALGEKDLSQDRLLTAISNYEASL